MNLCFCISARNRRHILEETLHSNLQAVNNFTDAQIALVNYGSEDGLSDYIWEQYESHIASGKLIYFDVTTPVRWSAPKAKNLAHRIARSKYLFNLDADNYVTSDDISVITYALRKGLVCHQFTGDWGDGSCGRIGMSRKLFMQLGGYDECLLPMGYQDIDLLKRACLVTNSLILRLRSPGRSAIPNKKIQSINALPGCSEANQEQAEKIWNRMNDLNRYRAAMRLKIEQSVALLGGFSTYEGLLNGRLVRIDGLNNGYDLTKSQNS